MIGGWRFPPPGECPFCDTTVRSLPWAPVWKRICPYCCEGFSPIEPPYCHRCGRAGEEALCTDCRSHPYPELMQNCSAVSYTPRTREVIRLYKFLGRERFARPMGEMMVSVAARRGRKPDIISYVPLHPSPAGRARFQSIGTIGSRHRKEMGCTGGVIVSTVITHSTAKSTIPNGAFAVDEGGL